MFDMVLNTPLFVESKHPKVIRKSNKKNWLTN